VGGMKKRISGGVVEICGRRAGGVASAKRSDESELVREAMCRKRYRRIGDSEVVL